MKRVQEIRK